MATPNFDFLGVRWMAIGASLVLIAIGMAAVVRPRLVNCWTSTSRAARRSRLRLNPDDKMPIADVRDALVATPNSGDKNLLVVERGKSRHPLLGRHQRTIGRRCQANHPQTRSTTSCRCTRSKSARLKPFSEGTFTGTQATVIDQRRPGIRAGRRRQPRCAARTGQRVPCESEGSQGRHRGRRQPRLPSGQRQRGSRNGTSGSAAPIEATAQRVFDRLESRRRTDADVPAGQQDRRPRLRRTCSSTRSKRSSSACSA